MGLKTKIHLRYELNDPPNMVKPNDELSGTLYIENQDKKDKKIKKLFISCVEVYEEYTKNTDAENNVTWEWEDKRNELKRFDLTTGEKIKSGDSKSYEFDIKLPGSWRKKKGEKLRSWHLTLQFMQKTGMMATLGANPDDALCVLPVEGSEASPSFGS